MKYENEPSFFSTKSMSLNVSGKHNNKCKSMYTKFFFFSVFLTYRMLLDWTTIFFKKKKSSIESSFCGVNGFFLSYGYECVCLFSFCATAIPHTHKQISISKNAETKDDGARNSKISKPAAVTNHLTYHHFSWLLRVLCFVF